MQQCLEKNRKHSESADLPHDNENGDCDDSHVCAVRIKPANVRPTAAEHNRHVSLWSYDLMAPYKYAIIIIIILSYTTSQDTLSKPSPYFVLILFFIFAVYLQIT